MENLHIALDFDDLLVPTSVTKANWIVKHVPNWKELLAEFKAEEFRRMHKLPSKAAAKKGEEYAGNLSRIPLWLTDRHNCINIIGKENYENMSYEIYGHVTLQNTAIEGVREGIKELVQKHELTIVTSRREEHLEFVEKWLENNRMNSWFIGIHSLRGFSKVPFCIQRKIDVLVDDEMRFLIGYAPGLLKILVKSEFNDSTTVRLKEDGSQRIVPIKNIIKSEGIKCVPKFNPFVMEAIGNHSK